MASPTSQGPVTTTCRYEVVADLLVLYIRRKRQLTSDYYDDVHAIHQSTWLEYQLEQTTKPYRPGPDSLADLLLLVDTVVSSQTTPVRRVLAAWLCYGVALPLFVLSRLPSYVDEAYWWLVVLGRVWRAARNRGKRMAGVARALRESAEQDLALSPTEAEELVDQIVVTEGLGNLFGMFDL